jgi:hypothetical protein
MIFVQNFGASANAGVEDESQLFDPPFGRHSRADPRAAQQSGERPFAMKIPFGRRDDAIIRYPLPAVEPQGVIEPSACGIDRREAPA